MRVPAKRARNARGRDAKIHSHADRRAVGTWEGPPVGAQRDLDALKVARVGTEVADYPKDAPGLVLVRQRSRAHSTWQDQGVRAPSAR